MERHEQVSKRLKKFEKKWRTEVANLFVNLETLLTALSAGTKPAQLRHLGFVHAGYSLGVLSIDQRGSGKGARLKQFRLYVFPEEDRKVLHVLTLGDKETQDDDVRHAERVVQELLRRKEQWPDANGGSPEEAEESAQ